MFATQSEEASTVDNIMDVKRYSSLLKLFRITALVLRFINNLKKCRNKEVMLR